jgi:hypothetical protein
VTQANRIATSIAARPGASSALLTAAKAAVSNAQATATRILMMKAQITSPAPTVNAKGWALYGHVYNSSGAAVDAYSVYFVDSTNTYQNAYGIAYTASDGSYRIVNSGPAAGQSAPATPQLFLQVGNAAGDPIYTSSSAFTPVTGKATYEDVTLPAGEKVLGKLPTVLRTVILPAVEEKPALTVDPPKSEG